MFLLNIALVVFLLASREIIRRFILRRVRNSASRGLLEWTADALGSFTLVFGVVLLVIQPFIAQAFSIPSGSMEDTLQVGDRPIVSKIVYRLHGPRFQDVIVFKAPDRALRNEEHKAGEVDFIKRCMGVPGDVVYAKNRSVYRNGKLVTEPYKKWTKPTFGLPYSYDMKIVDGKVYSREYLAPEVPGLWETDGSDHIDQDKIENAKPGAVPPGKYLVLGDHRNNSNDSHIWGFVPRRNILGKAVCIFWPPQRLGLM